MKPGLAKFDIDKNTIMKLIVFFHGNVHDHVFGQFLVMISIVFRNTSRAGCSSRVAIVTGVVCGRQQTTVASSCTNMTRSSLLQTIISGRARVSRGMHATRPIEDPFPQIRVVPTSGCQEGFTSCDWRERQHVHMCLRNMPL